MNPRSDGLVSTNEHIKVAIDRYEKEIVNPIISEINLSVTKQMIYHTSLIVLGFLTSLTPIPVSMLGPLIGFMGISANWNTALRTLERYYKDRRYLMHSLTHLRLLDEASPMEAKKLMKSYLARASNNGIKFSAQARAEVKRKDEQEPNSKKE